MTLTQTAKALADTSRIRILAALRLGELAVGEIALALGLGQSRVSRHLNILAAAGLVSSRRDGRWVFYALPESGPQRVFLEASFELADSSPDLESDARAVRDVLTDRARETSRFFDSVATKWREMRAESLGGFDLSGKIAELTPRVTTAADLGCGPGETLARMAGKAERLIGVDSSPEMLKAASRLLGRDASLRLGDLNHLPMAEAETDFAAMSLVLHHLADPAGAVREAFRVLRAPGTLVVADFNAHEKEEMRTFFGDRRLGFAPDEIPGWLTEAGFAEIGLETLDLPSGLALTIYTALKQ